MNKGTPNNKPRFAALSQLDVPTNQTDVPCTYFAGTRKLNVSWIMSPVIAFTKPSGNQGKGK